MDNSILPAWVQNAVPPVRIHLPLPLSLILGLLCGCALAPSNTDAAVEAPSQVTQPNAPVLPSPQEQAQYHVMVGELAAGRQQPKVAAQEFLQALDFSPDAKLAARATAMALAADDEPLALKAARKWQATDPTSLDSREVITRLALRAGLDDEAYAECASIVTDHPGGQDDGMRHVALLLAQEPDHSAQALALMARLVAQYPKLSGAYQAQGLLALRFNQPDVAEHAAREALRLKPQSKEASLLLVGALVKKNDIAGADQVMDSLLKNSQDSAELRLGYARLLIENDQAEHGREQLEKILKSDPNDADAHYSLGLLELDEHKPDQAEPHFQFLARKADRLSDGEYFLGRIAEMRNQPAQALAHYDKVTTGTQALDASVRRAAMLGKLGRLDEATTTLEELRGQFPPLADRFILAEGEILFDANAYDKALALYDGALKEDPDDGDLLYSRSLVYERTNHIGEAEADLRRILDKAPDDSRALNALGYTLAVHSERLDEADKLVSRALQITPDDPAVIDSLGWLRFRQGRAQEALPLLQKAYKQFPDAEVAAHLGEVLWTLGDKDQARSLLTQASKGDPENPVLRDTVKRLAP
jgi:tetratricopeptide (TPR) repeat protein